MFRKAASIAFFFFMPGLALAAPWQRAASPLPISSLTGARFACETASPGRIFALAIAAEGAKLLISTDGGGSYALIPGCPSDASDIFLTTGGTLYAWRSTASSLASSQDFGMNWTSLANKDPLSLSDASFVLTDGTSPLVTHRDGLLRLAPSGNEASSTGLFQASGSRPEAGASGSFALMLYRGSGGSDLFAVNSTDSGSSWANPWRLAAGLGDADRFTGLALSSASSGSFLLQQGASLSMLSTTDSGVTWTVSRISAAADAGSPLALRRLAGIDLALFSSSGLPRLAESVDNGLSWRHSEVDGWTATAVSAYVLPSGAPLWLDAQAGRFELADPFHLNPPRPYAAALFGEARVEWPSHPLALSYDLYIAGALAGSASAAPLRYASALENGNELRLVPVSARFRGSVASGYSKGTAGTLSYYLPAGKSMEDYRMVSFPPHARVPDSSGAALSPKAFLERSLGSSYNPSIWQFGRWKPAVAGYESGAGMSEPAPGESFWIICAFHFDFTCQYNENESATSFVRLQPGWNMIATPYGRSTSWKSASVMDGMRELSMAELTASANPVLSPDLWAWSPSGYGLSSSLEPGQGCWVRNDTGRELLLVLRKPSLNAKPEKPESIRRYSAQTPPLPPGTVLGQTKTGAAGGGGGCVVSPL